MLEQRTSSNWPSPDGGADQVPNQALDRQAAGNGSRPVGKSEQLRDLLVEIDATTAQLTTQLANLLHEAQLTLIELHALHRLRTGDPDDSSDVLGRRHAVFRHGLDVHRNAEEFHQRAAAFHAQAGRVEHAEAEREKAATHRRHYLRLRAQHPDWAPPNDD